MKKVAMIMLLCLTTSMLLMAGCDKNNNEAQKTESTGKTAPEQKVPEVTEKEAKTQQNDSGNHTNQGTQKGSEEKAATGLNKAEFLNELSSLEKQEKHSENTVTTVDIRAEINENYQLWDNKLKEIYRVLKNNMSANAFETLKSKQIAWIKSKESRVQAIRSDPNNGTMALIEADEAGYTMTKERCYELVNSYMN